MTEPPRRASRLLNIVGGSAGNFVEYFDWYAYTIFALYFAPSFFPKGDQTAQLLSTAAVFAVGFFMRPIGAVIMGRRTFDIVDGPNGWTAPDGTQFSLPVFVLTAEAQPPVTKGVTPFSFVTCGFETALAQARVVAGDKNIAVMGANIAQQCLQAGLLDEMEIHIAPLLLGEGIRLFDHIGACHIALASTRVIESPGVTHLRFSVLGSSVARKSDTAPGDFGDSGE